MTLPVAIIERSVNLRSYATSPGFLGFFERKGDFSIEICEKAIDILLHEPMFDVSRLSIVSNLFVVGDDAYLENEYGFGDREISEHILPLESEGLLSRIGPMQDCNDRLDGCDLEAKTGLAVRTIRTVFSAVMSIDGVRGHCFAVSPDHDLIFYPHDDSGFGFISTSQNTCQQQHLCDYIVRHFSDTSFRVGEKASSPEFVGEFRLG